MMAICQIESDEISKEATWLLQSQKIFTFDTGRNCDDPLICKYLVATGVSIPLTYLPAYHTLHPSKMETRVARFSLPVSYTMNKFLFAVLIFQHFAYCKSNLAPVTILPISTNIPKPEVDKVVFLKPNLAINNHKTAAVLRNARGVYVIDPSERFCRNIPTRPFYQRASDGAVCCRGRQLPIVTLLPETTGECAISTKTDENGVIDTENLWCAYTCSLKKIGAIDRDGRVVPGVFFNHLADGLTTASKNRLRNVMAKYLECFHPLKNRASPCHTPLNFQKCFLDAIYYLCSYGMPKTNDLTRIRKLVQLDYSEVSPTCFHNKRKASAGCCVGKPMPWTVMEIMETPDNETQVQDCMRNYGPECSETCLLKSIDAVNKNMEMDAGIFQRTVLKHFPAVRVPEWMNHLDIVSTFYTDVINDLGDKSSDSSPRICRFHDRIMELHEKKVEQYCAMTRDQVKELILG